MRTLIVTAADEGFMPLLRGLVLSLHQWEEKPFSAFAFLDLGLAPESREWISRYAAHVVVPGWDLPVDSQLRVKEPYLRAVTARPFLKDYFPGYDVYLWIDADAWVQERSTLQLYFDAAAKGALAAAPQVDRAYRHSPGAFEWRRQRMRACFGEAAARRVDWDTYFNAGVYALHADAPHWGLWARHFRDSLVATDGTVCSDQTALNHMLWTERVPTHPLPAYCNWACHLAFPGFHSGKQKFCEPFAPHHAIGILHLTAKTKDARVGVRADAEVHSTSLRFPERGGAAP